MTRVEAFISMENMCYRSIVNEPEMRHYTLDKVVETVKRAMLDLDTMSRRYDVKLFPA